MSEPTPTLADNLRQAETVWCLKCLMHVTDDDVKRCNACNAFVKDDDQDRRRMTESSPVRRELMDLDPNATDLLNIEKERLQRDIDRNFVILNSTPDLADDPFRTAELCLKQRALLKQFDRLNETP
jgi:hypothetical protein